MKKFLKKAILAVLTLALAAGMVACAQPGTPANSAAPAPSSKAEDPAPASSESEPVDYSKVKFEIAWWGTDTRNESTTKMIEEFEKQFEGLKVQVSFANFGDHFTRLTTLAAGGGLPDVMQMDYTKISSFATNNQLLVLDDMIADKSIDLTNVDDSFLDAGIVNGKMYGISTGLGAYCMFYDSDLLQNNGITMKAIPTWSEFAETCKQVYEKTGEKAWLEWNFGSGANRYLEIYIRSLGKQLVVEDGKSVGFTPEMLAEFWGFCMDAVEGGYVLLPGEISESTSLISDNPPVWLHRGDTNAYAGAREGYKKEYNKNVAMMYMPIADNATTPAAFVCPVMQWCVAANTEHPEIASAFLDFYVNDTKVYDITGTDRGVPISSKIRDYLSPNVSLGDKEAMEFLDYLAKAENSSAMSPQLSAAYAEAFDNYFVPVYEQISYSKIKREDLLAKAQETVTKMNDALAKAG